MKLKNNLIAALDKHDNVGVLDSFFPDAKFFTETELFDRHLEKIKNQKDGHVDFFSICTPNYLHDSHIRIALRRGADAICEKPLVLNPWNVEALSKWRKIQEIKFGMFYNLDYILYYKIKKND